MNGSVATQDWASCRSAQTYVRGGLVVETTAHSFRNRSQVFLITTRIMLHPTTLEVYWQPNEEWGKCHVLEQGRKPRWPPWTIESFRCKRERVPTQDLEFKHKFPKPPSHSKFRGWSSLRWVHVGTFTVLNFALQIPRSNRIADRKPHFPKKEIPTQSPRI